MRLAAATNELAASRWTSRIALFSLGLLATAACLHRLFGMPTPVAFNLFLTSMGGALLSILLGLLAAIGIWRSGRDGTARIVFGVFLSVVMLLVPVLSFLYAHQYPPLNDVSTDTVSPPEFVALAKVRGPGDNSPVYPGPTAAVRQAAAYPDLKPMSIDRSSEETFELVLDAVRRMKMHIVREQAPDADTGDAGVIEAVDRTLILGLYDDVSILVSGDDEASRVDVRSASRFGGGDLGRNAERVRQIMHEITMRVQATVPMAADEREQRSKRGAEARVKRAKDADPKQANRRKSPVRDQ